MIDLHIHTSHSPDAVDEPCWAVERAKQRGLLAIAITDHGTIKGWREARRLARDAGIRLVPGIEVGAKHPYRGQILLLHILAYLFRDEQPLDDLVRRQCEHSLRYRELLFEGLRKLGVPITPESQREEFPGHTPSTIFVRRQMRSRGHATDKIESADLEYRAIAEVAEPDLRESLPIDEVLPALKSSGATTIFHHPFNVSNVWVRHAAPEADTWDLIDDVLSCGVDGVEVWCPGRPLPYVDQLLDFARTRGLPVSGGSDSHSSREDASTLGTLNVPDWALDTLRRHQRGEDPWESLDAPRRDGNEA